MYIAFFESLFHSVLKIFLKFLNNEKKSKFVTNLLLGKKGYFGQKTCDNFLPLYKHSELKNPRGKFVKIYKETYFHWLKIWSLVR